MPRATDEQLQSFPCRQLHQLARFSGGEGHGLLHQHVQAAFERNFDLREMDVRRGCHNDGIKRLHGEQFLNFGAGVSRAKISCDFFRLFAAAGLDGDQLCRRMRPHCRQVSEGRPPTGTDHTDGNLLHADNSRRHRETGCRNDLIRATVSKKTRVAEKFCQNAAFRNTAAESRLR